MFYRPKADKLPKKRFNNWVLDNIADYSNRYEVYYGGGGSGKSYGAFQKIIFKCIKNKRRVLVIRKVGATMKDSVFLLCKSILSTIGIRYIENKTDLTIRLDNGTVFLFKGMDDPEKIKSIADITDIVIEEATELTQDDFTQLDIRLRPSADIKYPQIFLMFNPVSKANWCFKHWFEKGTPARTKIIHSTYKDNKFLTDEYRQTLETLAETNPNYYKIYCLGEFATLDKLVFPIIHKKLLNEEEMSKLPIWVGMDFGYINDPSAITWGRYDKVNKTIYITGEYNRKGMTNDVIADVLVNLGLSKEVIIADSAEQKSIAEIKKAGINRIKPAVKGKDSVINGLDKMLRHKIVIDERCINTIEEFENYTWLKDKKSGEYINKPVDMFNHHIDSIRYGIQDIIKNKGNLSGKRL